MANAGPNHPSQLQLDPLMQPLNSQDLAAIPPHVSKLIRDLQNGYHELKEKCNEQEQQLQKIKTYIAPVNLEAIEYDAESRLQNHQRIAPPLASTGLEMSPYTASQVKAPWSIVSMEDSWLDAPTDLNIMDDDLAVEDGRLVLRTGRKPFENWYLSRIISPSLLFYRLCMVFGHNEVRTFPLCLKHIDGSWVNFDSVRYYLGSCSFGGSEGAANDLCELLTFICGPSFNRQMGSLSNPRMCSS